MKLVFVSPTYGCPDPYVVKTQRIAIMHAAKHGHTWIGDASPDRQGYALARNNAVQSIINDDEYADAWMFWCDSDIILPQDAITRMAAERHDFICGIYFQREGKEKWPLVATFNGKAFNWIIKWPENSIMPADGCGFGCVLTSVRMLRKMEAPWFEYKEWSEDFDFCLKAKKAGFQLYCDTGVLCGHMADPEPVVMKHFIEAHPELFGGEDGGQRQEGSACISEDEQGGREGGNEPCPCTFQVR